MRSIRRLIYSVVVLAAILAGSFLLANSAHAAPYAIAPTLATGSQNPAVGAPVTLSGSGFTPGTPVELTLHTKVYVLGTTTVDSSGSFSITAYLPAGISGSHTLQATDPAGHILASLAVTIGAPPAVSGGPIPAVGNVAGHADGNAGAASSAGSGVGDSALPFSAIAIGGIILIALVLVVGGGAVMWSGRRRRANRL